MPSIKVIKKACPETVVCLEINSAFLVEAFPGLPLRPLFQRLEVTVLNQADAIAVVSSNLKEYLEKRGVPAEKILVNQNGVNIEAVKYSGSGEVRQEYGIPESSFLVGYIGGMETFRRLPEVVGAIARLRQAGNDDIYLMLVGDGDDMPAVQAAVKADGDFLRDALVCVGWQEHSDIPRFLAAFDIAVFPFTNAYCSPLKLFEYLGAGLPTIGPDTPAVREVFRDGVHLKLVKQDASDLTNAILELKNNPRLRNELAENGQKLVLNKYTWKKNAERVVQHIQNVRGHIGRKDR
ncbi:glycosyltransferase family 4 protein [Pseudomonadota bacterium]